MTASSLRPDGYWHLKIKGHPLAAKNGYVYEHRLVLWDKIGPGTHPCFYCKVPITWLIDLECDHKDHNKSNNHPDNLVPCCFTCNRTRWNTTKTDCPNGHGIYDGQYKNGWRYCKKCKSEKEKRRRLRIKLNEVCE